MSADGQDEPGSTMNGTPRSDDEQDARPYDFGPTFYANHVIHAVAGSVAGVLGKRSRPRTGVRGRGKSVHKENENNAEEVAKKGARTVTHSYAQGCP